MAVRVADEFAGLVRRGQCMSAGFDDGVAVHGDRIARQRDTPGQEIVGLSIGGQRSSAGRRDVFQELDPRTVRGPQCGDAEARAEDLVQVFLLRAPIFRAPATRRPSASW